MDIITSIIVAASDNHVIGKDNQLPWHLPADLKYFKNTTWAMPVIMGRKTYESIGKPLPGRHNIVITRNAGFIADGISVVSSVEAARELAATDDVREIFIIGGAALFNSTMHTARRIYLTRVHATIDGDVYFPEVSLNEWKLVKERKIQQDDKNPYPLSFQIWERQ